MKRYNTILVFVLTIFPSLFFAQSENCNCKAELSVVNERVKDIPAYKDNKEAFDAQWKIINERAEGVSNQYQCYLLLNKLLLTLKDNHTRAYGLNLGYTTEVQSDSSLSKEFRSSRLFNGYPRIKLDLDSLNNELSSRNKKDIEGIYYHTDSTKIGVYHSNTLSGELRGVVLKSGSDIWSEGEVVTTYIPFGDNFHLAVGANIRTKRLVAYNERIENGLFQYMGFKKDFKKTDFSQSIYPDSTYIRKEISPDITYLKIGAFNAMYPNLTHAEEFYATLENTLNKNNVIVDLRDNGGGGDRNSKFLYKILKDYQKDNNVFVLINHRSLSNAELFTYRLRKFDNVTVLGRQSNGTLAYELQSESINLPCNNLIVALATKRLSNYVSLETVGLKPDYELSMDEDWIEQVKRYIAKK